MKIFLTFILLTLASCGTGMKISKSNFKAPYKNLSVIYQNNSFKTNRQRYGSPTLLSLFEIQNTFTDSVQTIFNEAGDLKIVYSDTSTQMEKIFHGTFSKKGYWEIFLRNKKKEIPPLMPIIYGKYNINRIRIALTLEDDLLIDNMWNESANIFIFGAGDKGRRQQIFQTIKLKQSKENE